MTIIFLTSLTNNLCSDLGSKESILYDKINTNLWLILRDKVKASFPTRTTFSFEMYREFAVSHILLNLLSLPAWSAHKKIKKKYYSSMVFIGITERKNIKVFVFIKSNLSFISLIQRIMWMIHFKWG